MTQRNRLVKRLLALAVAGTTFVTVGTCDPYTGFLDFYRDDDADDYYYSDYYYDDYYDPFFFDPCWFCF